MGKEEPEPGLRHPWLRHYEPEVPPNLDYANLSLPGMLAQSAGRSPESTALIYFGARISYRELAAAVDAFAAALAGLGVKKGDRSILYMPNCPQFVIAYYGSLKAGAIVVPTNPMYVEPELLYQVQDSGAETIVTLTKSYPTVKKVRPQTGLKHVIVGNIKDFFPPDVKARFEASGEKEEGHLADVDTSEPGTFFFEQLLADNAGKPSPTVKVSGNDLALLQYTGGTTGISKGAMLTHRNLLVNAVQMSNWIGHSKDGKDVTLAVLPLFHIYGMTLSMNIPVYNGDAMILVPRFQPQEVMEIIDKHRPTLFSGVPTMYIAVNNFPDASKYSLASIRACISGGSGLPVEVQQKFESLTGARLVEGYGLTEASPVTHCNPVNGLRKAGSIGVPIPDTEAKIVDLETGERVLPPGEAGELAVRGPQVMDGYWNRPDETELVFKDGWLLTGDIAKMDEDGFFYIVDRRKDMILASGYNIYPREIDEVLFQHPKVKQAVAVGVPDPYRGETVKAFVVLKSGETATEREIINFCRERLAAFKVPTAVEFRDSLPTSGAGKVLRRVLQEEEKNRLAGGK